MGRRRKRQRVSAQKEKSDGAQEQRRAADRPVAESSDGAIGAVVQQKGSAAEAETESATGNGTSSRGAGERPRALSKGEVTSAARGFSLSSLRGREIVILVAILLLASILAVSLFDPKPSVGGDNAHYLLLAKALATGRGYRSLESPGEPPHTHFPFGYPLLITPLAFLIPKSILPAKILSAVLFVGSLFILYPFLSRQIGSGLTLSVLALLATSPIMLEFSHWALSEIPFLFFTVLSLVLLNAAEEERRRSNWWFALGSICLVFTFHVRTVGIALILAVLVRLAWRRSIRRLVLLTFVLVLLTAPWFVRNARLPSDPGDPSTGSYTEQTMMVSAFDPEAGRLTLREYVVRVLRIITAYTRRVLPRVVIPPFWADGSLFEVSELGRTIIWPIVALLVVFGLILRLRRGPALFDLYVISYLCVLWAWANKNIAAGPRYLLPILPFLFLALLEGGDRLIRLGVPRRSTALAVLLVLALLAPGIIAVLPAVASNLEDLSAYLEGDVLAGYSDSWANYFSIAIFAYDKLPPNAIVMARKPALFYLYSHRKSVIYPYTRDVAKLYEAMADNNVGFVLVDAFRWTKTTRRYLIPAILSRADRFRVICLTVPPKTYLLQVLGDPREWSKEETDESRDG